MLVEGGSSDDCSIITLMLRCTVAGRRTVNFISLMAQTPGKTIIFELFYEPHYQYAEQMSTCSKDNALPLH